MGEALQGTVIFTRRGFLRGFRCTIPLAVGVCAYGLVFGMLAATARLSLIEALLMSLCVYAGASQLIAIELWTDPLPVFTIILTTFIVNARHLLMSAALQPWFRHLKPLQAYGSLIFCADENWALSMKEFQRGENDAAFLIGGGFLIYVVWAVATFFGYVGGAVLKDPAAFGLDFAFTAVFISLLISLWDGKRDLIPWIVAGALAVVANRILPGKWYILVGALAGSGLEAFRRDS